MALAPVASTHNIEVGTMQTTAPFWRLIQFAAERTGAYNIVGVNWWQEESILLFCGLWEGLCESFIKASADADPSVDNMDRLDVMLSNYPAGSSY